MIFASYEVTGIADRTAILYIANYGCLIPMFYSNVHLSWIQAILQS